MASILVKRLGTTMTVGKLAELVEKYGTVESIEMDPTISSVTFYDDYKRFAHIVFTTPAAATRAQKAIDGVVVDGRKLICDKVSDQAYENIPRALSMRPMVYMNPNTFVYSSYNTQTNVVTMYPWYDPRTQGHDHWSPQSSTRKNARIHGPDHWSPQPSRRVIVKRSQEAVPAAKRAKEVTIDLTADENTTPAAEPATVGARKTVSQAGTSKRPYGALSPSRSRGPSPEPSRKRGRFDDDTDSVSSSGQEN
ncbi:hypothetical protein HK104_009701 [Borealophlyctis nickersoniae]|nr:hypothetical protein HK104_009701 [Borealophlyctis nickersoniae]